MKTDATAIVQPASNPAAELRTAFDAFQQYGRKRLDQAVVIGGILAGQKKLCDHGKWVAWLADNFEYGRKRAADFMRVHAERGKLRHVASFEEAIQLLKCNRPVTNENENPSETEDEAPGGGEDTPPGDRPVTGGNDDPDDGQDGSADSEGGETDEGKGEDERPPPDPAAGFVGEVNRVCKALDAYKAEVERLAAEPFGRHIHVESVTSGIQNARKALWQSRPTEPCNCVQGDGDPAPACKACFGTGRTTAARVLKKGGGR